MSKSYDDPEQYNGWTNRETWAVALHINNDQGWQESVHEALRGMDRDVSDTLNLVADRIRHEVEQSALAYRAGEIIRENVEGTLEPYEIGSGALSLARGQWLAIQDIGSLWRVAWSELGAAFLSDLAEEDDA